MRRLAGTNDIKGRAILFSEMTPPDGREDDFNDWYDGHHSPSHVQGVPGFISAMRYKADAGPHYLAVYELTGPEALEHEEYKKRKLTPDDPTYKMLQSVSGFTRYIAREHYFREQDGVAEEPLDAEIIFCAFFTIPDERAPEFAKWFDEEHAAMLQENPDWLLSRRMEIVQYDPEPYTDMVLHYLRNEGALEAAERATARETEWSRKLRAEPWFDPHFVTYRRRRDRFLKSG